MNNLKKISPVTLIVGGSSLISQEIINSLSETEKLILISRSDYCDKKVRLIKHNLGVKAFPINKITKILKEGEYIKNIIYTSSMQVGRKNLLDLSDEDIKGIFNVNIINLIILVRSILKNRPRLPGSIILFGSQATIFGGNKISAYSASKGAVEVFTKALAKEVGLYGLRVNCLSLGLVRSEKLLQDDFIEQEISKTIPLNRIGEPIDVVNAIKWLSGDSSDYITGAIIPVAGGR